MVLKALAILSCSDFHRCAEVHRPVSVACWVMCFPPPGRIHTKHIQELYSKVGFLLLNSFANQRALKDSPRSSEEVQQ